MAAVGAEIQAVLEQTPTATQVETIQKALDAWAEAYDGPRITVTIAPPPAA